MQDDKETKKPKATILGIGYGVRGGKWKAYVAGCSKKTATKEYTVWKNMIQRCYSEAYLKRRPTYRGCSVTEEWLNFQVFAEWLTSQDFYLDGYELEKDILKYGNKVYSPETCTLIPQEINSLVLDCKSTRGEFPIGVTWHKKYGKFKSQIRIFDKNIHLGYFDCPQEAHMAYVKAKEAHVKVIANKWKGRIEERVYLALMNWKVKDN